MGYLTGVTPAHWHEACHATMPYPSSPLRGQINRAVATAGGSTELPAAARFRTRRQVSGRLRANGLPQPGGGC
jgi:hypothetical protein